MILQGNIVDIPNKRIFKGEITFENEKMLVSAQDYKLKINVLGSNKEGYFSGKQFLQFLNLKKGAKFLNPLI